MCMCMYDKAWVKGVGAFDGMACIKVVHVGLSCRYLAKRMLWRVSSPAFGEVSL